VRVTLERLNRSTLAYRCFRRGYKARTRARHEFGTRRPDRCAASRANSTLSTLPAPIPTRTAPMRAPRTCWGPGRCRRTRRQQRGIGAARAPTRAARTGTVRAGAAVRGLDANQRSDARVGGNMMGTQAASASTDSQQQGARERVERRPIGAQLRPDSATRERTQCARGASDARCARWRLRWRVGRGRRCHGRCTQHTLLTAACACPVDRSNG
jgi:hypothetical protein